MKQPSLQARRELSDIMNDTPTVIAIPGTRRTVKVRGIKPYTIERLTALWLERDASIPTDSGNTLRSLCIEPYFAVKEALLFTLNSYWKIRLFYPLMWRIWAKWRGYTEEQMNPIIVAGKKKLPLTAHWMNMAFSVDMRDDWVKMTNTEADQYRAELHLVAEQASVKNSQNTGEQGVSSLG